MNYMLITIVIFLFIFALHIYISDYLFKKAVKNYEENISSYKEIIKCKDEQIEMYIEEIQKFNEMYVEEIQNLNEIINLYNKEDR